MKNLIQSKLAEFRKKDFYFTNENGKRILHTNIDITDDVEREFSQSLEEAYRKGREDENKDLLDKVEIIIQEEFDSLLIKTNGKKKKIIHLIKSL